MSRFSRQPFKVMIAALGFVLLVHCCVAQQKPMVKPVVAGRVTAVNLSVTFPKNVPCPVKLSFSGTITVNGPAEVRYTWVSFDGGTWPERTINFRAAGTQKVGEVWTLGAPGQNKTGWLQLKVISPNTFLSRQDRFIVNCAGPGGAKGRVTAARLAVANYPRNGPCPVKLNFNGTITTNGPAEVKYTWVSFDGGTWPEGTLTFRAAGTQRVTQQWQLGAPGDSKSGWLQLKVISPNTLVSPRASFSVRCPK